MIWSISFETVDGEEDTFETVDAADEATDVTVREEAASKFGVLEFPERSLSLLGTAQPHTMMVMAMRSGSIFFKAIPPDKY